MRRLLFLAMTATAICLAACALNPIERPDAQEIARASAPLPRAIAVRVEPKEEAKEAGCYGAPAAWEADLIRAFESLEVAAAVWPSEREAEADMSVTVVIMPQEPAGSQVHATGAFLDVLAWTTIPLLPLWIPDVEVNPGLKLQVLRSLSGAGEGGDRWQPETLEAGAFTTCFLERYPFFSWPTLGALFVPPFIFSGLDRDRLEEALGEELRLDLAVKAARLVKATTLDRGELLADLKVLSDRDSLALSYRPLPGLRKVDARLELPAPREGNRATESDIVPFNWDAGSAAARTIPLQRLLASEGPTATPRWVRVEAIGETGAPLRYTVRLPTGATPVAGRGR